MDFSLAERTQRDGFQLDLKTPGVGHTIITEAIQVPKEARTKILEIMRGHADQPRTELSKYAPRIETIKLSGEDRPRSSGRRQKTIKGIVAETGAELTSGRRLSAHLRNDWREHGGARRNIIGGMTAKSKSGKTYQGTRRHNEGVRSVCRSFSRPETAWCTFRAGDFRMNRTEDVSKIGDMDLGQNASASTIKAA